MVATVKCFIQTQHFIAVLKFKAWALMHYLVNTLGTLQNLVKSKTIERKKVVNDLVEIAMMIVKAAPTPVAELSGALGIMAGYGTRDATRHSPVPKHQFSPNPKE